jgi:ANTAR domain/GAF domain
VPGCTGHPEPPAAGKAFTALTALVAEAQPMAVVLEAVAFLAHHVVPGAAGVSVLRPAGDGVSGLVRTAELAQVLDVAQSPGGGPGVDAARTGEVVHVVDARTEDRWSRYAEEAVGCGALSCLAVPVPAPGAPAALCVYGRAPGGFDCAACSLATRFAGHAAAALGYLTAEQLLAAGYARDLEVLLGSRAVVDRATGILVERHALGVDQAREALARAAAHRGVPAQEIATELVATGLFDPRYLGPGALGAAGAAATVTPLRARAARAHGCGRPSRRR